MAGALRDLAEHNFLYFWMTRMPKRLLDYGNNYRGLFDPRRFNIHL